MRTLQLILAVVLLGPACVWADPTPIPTATTVYEKPAAAEREANGFDPEGVEYHQNKLEDFQIVFVETAPFAALVSYGLTTLISFASTKSAKMNKKDMPFFIGGTVLLSGGAAYYSVSGKPYPMKEAETPLLPAERTAWAVQGDLVRIRF